MSEEYRKLKPEELDSYINMAAQAFRMSPPDAARWKARNNSSDDPRGLFVDGELRTGLRLMDFDMWFGPSTVATGGIGAVASPPENRRQGLINRLLYNMLVELRERNRPLAILYPFYFPFYKRFGWSHVTDSMLYKIPMDRLPVGKKSGSWQRVYVNSSLPTEREDGGVSSDDLAVLMDIYDKWCVGQNGPIRRDEAWWRQRRLGIGRSERPDVYYWRDPSGEPRAYAIYYFETLDHPWERRMQCELIALDPTALRVGLAFLRDHDSQAKEVWLRVPESLRLAALIDDPEFKIEAEEGLMLRLADVPAAIESRRYPEHLSEQFTIRVRDSFLDWNEGTYIVTVRDGTANVGTSNTEPAVSLDQKVLAQIYAGYLTPQEALVLGLIEVADPAGVESLARTFAGPRPFIADFF